MEVLFQHFRIRKLKCLSSRHHLITRPLLLTWVNLNPSMSSRGAKSDLAGVPLINAIGENTEAMCIDASLNMMTSSNRNIFLNRSPKLLVLQQFGHSE